MIPVDQLSPPKAPDRPFPVIALHCSGATGRQWRRLSDLLAPRAVSAPDLFGTPARGHWDAPLPFTLEDEARSIVERCLPSGGRVHIVGHSYGGALALHLARRFPDRVASLSLYEPIAFELLSDDEKRDHLGRLHEIASAARFAKASLGGACGGAAFEQLASEFACFWSGPDAWHAMSERARADVIHYIGQSSVELDALLNEPSITDPGNKLRCPVLILIGSDPENPAALASMKLHKLVGYSMCRKISGAGHMGPLTHADAVNAAILEHIRDAEDQTGRGGSVSRRRQE